MQPDNSSSILATPTNVTDHGVPSHMRSLLDATFNGPDGTAVLDADAMLLHQRSPLS